VPASLNNGSPGGRTTGSKLGDAEKAMKACTELEAEIAELQAAYEQYFLGMERRPPTQKHTSVKKLMNELRNTFVNSTPVKFRIGSLQQRLNTFERLWERTLLEIENGTYKRDVYKARRHADERKKRKAPTGGASDGLDDLHIDEDLDLSDLDSGSDDLESAMSAAAAAVEKPKPVPGIPSVAPLVPTVAPAVPGIPSVKPLVPGVNPKTGPISIPPVAAPSARPVTGAPLAVKAPATATGSNPALKSPSGSLPPARPAGTPSKPPTPVGSDGGLNDGKIKAIYDAYVMAKKRCGEDTSKLSLDSVASTLRSQVPTLMKQHNAKSVEFKVVIKDGKAVLRALPKE
jgi:hypothetical protein